MIAFAKKRADVLATTDVMKHDAKGYGENLAWNWSSAGPSPIPASRPVQSWYDEIKDYNFKNPKAAPFHKVGHFTQVVWKKSTRLGCGQAGSKHGVFTVCIYNPAGNTRGRYSDNVRRPN